MVYCSQRCLNYDIQKRESIVRQEREPVWKINITNPSISPISTVNTIERTTILLGHEQRLSYWSPTFYSFFPAKFRSCLSPVYNYSVSSPCTWKKPQTLCFDLEDPACSGPSDLVTVTAFSSLLSLPSIHSGLVDFPKFPGFFLPQDLCLGCILSLGRIFSVWCSPWLQETALASHLNHPLCFLFLC